MAIHPVVVNMFHFKSLKPTSAGRLADNQSHWDSSCGDSERQKIQNFIIIHPVVSELFQSGQKQNTVKLTDRRSLESKAAESKQKMFMTVLNPLKLKFTTVSPLFPDILFSTERDLAP